MTYLEFMFSGFWVFIGHMILITAVLNGLAEVVKAFRSGAR